MSCNEWKEYALKDLIDIKHGYAFKGKFFSEEETNLILLTPGNFKIGGGFQAKKLKYYSKDGEVPEQYILRENDILVTMTDLSKSGDTLGYPIKVPVLENKILLHNQRLGKVEIKSDKIDKDFLYYLMCSNKYRNEVLASATGTTVKHSAPDRILKFEFGLPSIEEQQKIANILSCLDDKIELNNEMNKTLEEMAQSLFKRWFVDFEFPSDDGQPYKSSGGEMVDSELGMIPKGWEVKSLGEVIEKIVDNRGKTPPRDKFGIPLIEGHNITMFNTYINTSTKQKYVNEDTYNTWFRSGHPEYLDILCATVGTLPKWCFVGKNDKICTAQNIIALRVKKEIISPYYLKNYMDTNTFIQMFNGRITTTAQPSIKVGHLTTIKIIIPEYKVVKLYDELVNNIYELVEGRRIENQQLEEIRDSLLPKLMSGEISLK